MPDNLKDKSLFREQCLINGQWSDADDKAALSVTNPATGRKLGVVPDCGVAETKRPLRPPLPPTRPGEPERPWSAGALLRAWEQAIQENLDDLARILTLEEGKPLAEARGEILQGASYFPWFAEEWPPRLRQR